MFYKIDHNSNFQNISLINASLPDINLYFCSNGPNLCFSELSEDERRGGMSGGRWWEEVVDWLVRKWQILSTLAVVFITFETLRFSSYTPFTAQIPPSSNPQNDEIIYNRGEGEEFEVNSSMMREEGNFQTPPRFSSSLYIPPPNLLPSSSSPPQDFSLFNEDAMIVNISPPTVKKEKLMKLMVEVD